MNEEFERLYETYHHSLFQFLFYMVRNRQIAEELVQEVYIKVFNSYSSFKGDSSEKTWLYSIARHVGVDWIRSQNRKKRKFLGIFELSEKEYQIRDAEPLPDEIVLEREEMKEVYQMLGKCSFDQQQVIILRYIEALSISETANILGWTESKVKTTQHRAIKSLQELLGANHHSDLKEVGR
ncbi:RNA polymerase sigma factor SigX [Anaerobacillus isosaccharinicus]|uniref:RNA polymerase sigma factor n=1 Tax=Anaerobacillus isosaccharinicus TaxID=1532552 RepID=A0A1S2MFX0_9BACI|nr:RNA polymerase sigma factor SigX [Anaerobacillus isosaccharinicus]MBA5588855.1 sigma-70 family RNA polymerase sigma factor [Anaerobacillus isosaccharinicus]QOY37757.1 sigma-70 family RNA polymerase sigma factor [Anaerobacillus isosaccharinicus]